MKKISAKELYVKFGVGFESEWTFTVNDDPALGFAIYASGYYSLPEMEWAAKELKLANTVFGEYMLSQTKVTLHTKAIDGGPFNCAPAMSFDMAPCDVLINDVVLPGEYNPHNVRLWIIGHTFGPIVAVWAAHVQDALDAAVDHNRMDGFKAEPLNLKDGVEDHWTALGNAGELFDLDDMWIKEVVIDPARDKELMSRFDSNRIENHKSQTLEY